MKTAKKLPSAFFYYPARVIFDWRKFGHVSDLRESLGWMPKKSMADFQTLQTAHKILTHGDLEASDICSNQWSAEMVSGCCKVQNTIWALFSQSLSKDSKESYSGKTFQFHKCQQKRCLSDAV